MKFYQNIVRPLFFTLKPEAAHEVVMTCLRAVSSNPFLLNVLQRKVDPKLSREVFGVRFPSPIGLAAGFDKNAEALPAWAALGFGFVEIGTVTSFAQPGNPQPRLFRYPAQQALINRMGFNNDGAHVIGLRLESLVDRGLWPQVPVGINLGKSKRTSLQKAAGDYLQSFQNLHPYGQYFVINVSSPNTPGLRELQDKTYLKEICITLQDWNRRQPVVKPVLVKIAPDLSFSQLDDVLSLATDCGLAGIIATNTTLDHGAIAAGHDETGGLSGAPLTQRSTDFVRHITRSSGLPVIASGGVMDADCAMEKFDAGASLVQLYTGYVYRGPGLIREIEAAILRQAVTP